MTVNVAIIGAGGIGSTHLNTLKDDDRANVVAVCDIAEDVASGAAERVSATCYTDHEEMLERETPDALFVAVPPFAHTTQETLGAEQGLDLFVEKPIALTREKATEVDATIDDAGVMSQVGHMYRYSEVVERAKELLEGRDLTLIDGRWLGGVPPAGWWGIKEKSGGQLVEQTAHVFDLVRYFGGEVESISAEGGKNVVMEDIDFEDSVSATMKHENGVVSHVATSAASAEPVVDLHLVADNAKLHLEFWVEGENPAKAVGSLTGTVDGERIELTTHEDAWSREVHAFLEAVDTGNDALLRSPYSDARETFELTLAVDEALEANAPSPMVR